MLKRTPHGGPAASWTAVVSVGGMLSLALGLAVGVAPEEATMGPVQRMVYLHVPLAWIALLGVCLLAACGGAYLVSGHEAWDDRAVAAGELGWLAATLTLLTGSLWAHRAWGTWWTWDPRLTSMLALWMMYSAWLLLRREMQDRTLAARAGALVSVIALADVPLVWFAARWFRGLHPVAPPMDARMYLVLGACLAALLGVWMTLWWGRSVQVAWQRTLIDREYDRLDTEVTTDCNWGK